MNPHSNSEDWTGASMTESGEPRSLRCREQVQTGVARFATLRGANRTPGSVAKGQRLGTTGLEK